MPDLSAVAAIRERYAAPSGSLGRVFASTKELGPEIFRLKKALGDAPEEATRATIKQAIVMRQAEWVVKAKAEGLGAPSRPIDPFRTTPREIENAFLWSEAGGVLPRDELARDGGETFRTSIRDAVVLRARGFDALVRLYDGKPESQRELYVKELARRGVTAPAAEALDAVRARYAASVRLESNRRPGIGLDGRVGTTESLDRYERQEAIDAMSPGTTLGSMMATYNALVTGEVDVERMRLLGVTGNTIEDELGGAGTRVRPGSTSRRW